MPKGSAVLEDDGALLLSDRVFMLEKESTRAGRCRIRDQGLVSTIQGGDACVSRGNPDRSAPLSAPRGRFTRNDGRKEVEVEFAGFLATVHKVGTCIR